MPIPFLIALAGALFVGGVAAAAIALATWGRIVYVVSESFIPWLDENFPSLGRKARTAFKAVDQLAGRAIQNIQAEWRALREELLQQVAEIEARADGTWLVRVTSLVRNSLQPSPDNYAHTVTHEGTLAFHQIPLEVRQSLIERGQTRHVLDVLKFRELELGLNDGDEDDDDDEDA